MKDEVLLTGVAIGLAIAFIAVALSAVIFR